MPRHSATGYTNDQLATWIAQRAGRALAADSPAYVSAARARSMGDSVPRGARKDVRANTLTFGSRDVSFTLAAVLPGGPDMSFRVAGMINPTLVVPAGATVRVDFVNADSDEAHGWVVVSAKPPFEFHVGQPALAGALARPLGDPAAAGDGAETITFPAGL